MVNVKSKKNKFIPSSVVSAFSLQGHGGGSGASPRNTECEAGTHPGWDANLSQET